MRRVIAVTVTYGDRWNYLAEVIEAAAQQGVAEIIVVDNGATHLPVEALESNFPERFTVVHLGSNTGSANAFATGLELAAQSAYEYVLLLDDDNRMDAGCLQAMLACLTKLEAANPAQAAAVFAHRLSRGTMHETRALQEALKRKAPFLGFDVADIPAKLRTRRVPRQMNNVLGDFSMLVGPYGGMLMSKGTLCSLGLPRRDFVLYCDDWEFTHRIHAAGGILQFCSSATIQDVDTAWGTSSPNAATAWINGGRDPQVYYAARNHVYFSMRFFPKKRARFALNLIVYVIILLLISAIHGRVSRGALLLRAIADGIRGHLGYRVPLEVAV